MKTIVRTISQIIATRYIPTIRPDARWRIRAGLALLGALILSRLLFFPRYLITFDQINFAFSIDDFNPAAHQPQPPGYPLFVGVLKLLSLWLPAVETVFLVAALLLSAASLVVLWMLGHKMLGAPWGFVAALLLLANPPFWFSAMTNPVRLSLSAGATAVAYCLFLACRRESPVWCVAAAALLGLVAGFRPALLIILSPLLLWVAFRLRLSWKNAAISLGAFALGIGSWLPTLVMKTGGVRSLIDVVGKYSYDQTNSTSVLMGAQFDSALDMASQAVVWSCLGVLSWLWAIPRAIDRDPGLVRDQLGRRFLLLWFLPGLIFYATFHVGDPDHTLSIVPVTCLAGARVLSAFVKGTSVRLRTIAVSVAVLLNTLLFFKPVSKHAKASTYTVVAWNDRWVADILEPVRNTANHDGLTLVLDGNVTGVWRHIAYYFPAVRLVVFQKQPDSSILVHRFQSNQKADSIITNGTVELPACGVIGWVDPSMMPRAAPESSPEVSTQGNVAFVTAAPNTPFHFRGLRFRTGPGPCPPNRRAAHGLAFPRLKRSA